MWSDNSFRTIGKGGWVNLLFGLAVTVFILSGNNIPLHAYVLDETYSPSTELKLDLNPVNQINNITLPLNDLISDAIKGLKFDQVINIGTGIPLNPVKSSSQNIDFNFNKFFSSSRVTPNDLTSFLKEAAITGINLSLLIISVTSQILKGLLSVLR